MTFITSSIVIMNQNVRVMISQLLILRQSRLSGIGGYRYRAKELLLNKIKQRWLSVTSKKGYLFFGEYEKISSQFYGFRGILSPKNIMISYLKW